MLTNGQTMPHATAAYGYFDVFGGRLFAGNGWISPEGFVAEERPWYKAAVEANGKAGVTDPYSSGQTGGL
jgi:hypothetical protein